MPRKGMKYLIASCCDENSRIRSAGEMEKGFVRARGSVRRSTFRKSVANRDHCNYTSSTLSRNVRNTQTGIIIPTRNVAMAKRHTRLHSMKKHIASDVCISTLLEEKERERIRFYTFEVGPRFLWRAQSFSSLTHSKMVAMIPAKRKINSKVRSATVRVLAFTSTSSE